MIGTAGETVLLRVDGMSCGSCVARVRSALETTPGTQDASVNLTTGIARVTINDINDLPVILKSLERAGYHAERLSGQTDLNNIAKLNNQLATQSTSAAAQALVFTLALIALHLLAPQLAVGDLHWVVLLEAIIGGWVIFWIGRDVALNALRMLVHRGANMDVLIFLGAGGAYFASILALALIVFKGQQLFDPQILYHQFHFHAATMIITFVLVGRALENGAKKKATEGMASLAKRQLARATVTRSGKNIEVSADQVKLDDWVTVNAGRTVPVDGTVVRGNGSVDESMLSGEAIPVEKHRGDTVLAGTTIADGMFQIKPIRTGHHTTLAAIIDLVARAQASRAPIQKLADSVAAVFVPVVIVLAMLTYLAWGMMDGEFSSGALRHAVAVLVVACPCALGLATPTAIVVAVGRAAANGILVRDAAILERAAKIDTVIFDKTGTLTEGIPELNRVEGENPSLHLRLAAAMSQPNQHPLARALVRAAAGEQLPTLDNYKVAAGAGCVGRLEENEIILGSAQFMTQHHVTGMNESYRVHLAIGGRWAAGFVFSDRPKEDAAATIKQLATWNISTAILSGDGTEAVRTTATELGVDRFYAERMPEQKLQLLRDLQSQGCVVAMVGDGINDAPSLAAADVGIVLGAEHEAADIAKAAADITLLDRQLDGVTNTIALARATVRIIKQNLFWAFFYNIVALPLAIAGMLPPTIASAAMMLSSITVVGNALRLKKMII